jgi:hypothetical protein
MSRLAVIFLMLACPALLEAQDAWIEQFDGKTLQGWEIDGDGKLENGVLKLAAAGPFCDSRRRLATSFRCDSSMSTRAPQRRCLPGKQTRPTRRNGTFITRKTGGPKRSLRFLKAVG